MRRFVFVCLSFLLVLRGWAPLRAQTTDNYPVQCTPLINTAYSLNLSDYATNTQMLTVQLRLKDLTKPQLQLYLKLRIEGVGIVIQTREGHIPSQPLTLLPGQAITLHGPDLAESFYPTNLDIQGLDPAFLFQGGTLPEGLYRVYFQAFDFERGRAVSNEGVALVNVFKRQPPLLLYPANNATLKPTLPQTLLLQWLPRDMASLNAASGGSTYTLRLYEVLDEDTDVNIIAQSQLPILEKTLPATSYFLGPSDVTLVAGRKYVWQVQVSSLDGRDVFLNGGRSQVSSFRYGGNCDPPASITVLGRGNGGVLLSWPGGEDAIRYVLRYRPESSTEWSQKVVYSTGTELIGLADGVYVYQVGSVCSGERAGAFSSEAGIGVVGGEASPVSLGGSSSARVASVAGVAGGASSGATAPTPVPTPEEEALNRLLNPGSVLVNTSGVKTEDMVKATLASLSKLVPPPCAGQVVTDPSCVSVAITYSGSPKGSLNVGDVLYVNTYQVVLTQVRGGGGTFSGEGIVTLPYLNNALFAVDFKNISVVGSVEQPGGCVTVGELVVAGSSNAALDKAVQSRLAALYQKAQEGAQKDEFVGKLDDALQLLDQTLQTIQQKKASGQTPSQEDLKTLQKALKAVKTYLQAFGDDLKATLGQAVDESIQATLSRTQTAIQQAIDCVETNFWASPSTPEKKGGPYLTAELTEWLACELSDVQLDSLRKAKANMAVMQAATTRVIREQFVPKPVDNPLDASQRVIALTVAQLKETIQDCTKPVVGGAFEACSPVDLPNGHQLRYYQPTNPNSSETPNTWLYQSKTNANEYYYVRESPTYQGKEVYEVCLPDLINKAKGTCPYQEYNFEKGMFTAAILAQEMEYWTSRLASYLVSGGTAGSLTGASAELAAELVTDIANKTNLVSDQTAVITGVLLPLWGSKAAAGQTVAQLVDDLKPTVKPFSYKVKEFYTKLADKLRQLAGKGVQRELWNGFTNIFKATIDEIAEATARIKNYRTVNNLKGGNYGYLEGVVNGKSIDNKMWRSISINDARNEIHIFDAIEVEGSGGNTWLRITDSEYRMLNQLASDLGGVKGTTFTSMSGELKIISENPYCASCQGIIQQFNEMFPNVKLILVDGAK